jgi:hypothetical protein
MGAGQYERGKHEKWDPFGRFFSLWIALVVAAAKHGIMTGIHHESDREAILGYCKDHAKRSGVIGAEEARHSEVKKLVRMELVTTLSETRRVKKATDALDKLRAYYDKGEDLGDDELVKCISGSAKQGPQQSFPRTQDVR